MNINIKNISRNKWIKIGNGDLSIQLLNNKTRIMSKFITSCVPRTPPFEIYKTKNFTWNREYDYMVNETLIRIFEN